MRKMLTIARREYAAMVATKGFLLSITVMPLLMFGGILAATLLRDRLDDVSDKNVVIADGTAGDLFAELKQAAEQHNQAIDAAKSAAAKEDDDDKAPSRIVLERHPRDAFTDEERLALSDRARNGDLAAFAMIPVQALGNDSPPAEFYASAATFSEERRWFERTLNDIVRKRRMAALNLDPAAVARATAPVHVSTRGLVQRLSGGRIGGGGEEQAMTSLFVPFGFMMLMFMIVMLAAQPLLESAIEEKNGRVAEVLLGSVNTFQLMLGKLLGNVGGSLTALSIYAVGGYFAAAYSGWTEYIPWRLVPWFVVLQILAVLLFSSIFMAVGSSVSQLKEAQSMLLPVWLVMCMPMFVWLQLVRSPNGPLAVGMSYFPPTAPLVMALRLASDQIVPAWQIATSLLTLVCATLGVTFIAARIFRVGILWQGKTPKMTELARWALRG